MQSLVNKAQNIFPNSRTLCLISTSILRSNPYIFTLSRTMPSTTQASVLSFFSLACRVPFSPYYSTSRSTCRKPPPRPTRHLLERVKLGSKSGKMRQYSRMAHWSSLPKVRDRIQEVVRPCRSLPVGIPSAADSFTFTLPKSLPNGQYLIRAEQVSYPHSILLS